MRPDGEGYTWTYTPTSPTALLLKQGGYSEDPCQTVAGDILLRWRSLWYT